MVCEKVHSSLQNRASRHFPSVYSIHTFMTSPNPANWSRLSLLLDELLDLQGPERQVRLEAMRFDNPKLGDELAALLSDSQSQEVKDFLAKPLLNAVDQPPESTLAGQRLGAYVLESPLGQGGTGSVWPRTPRRWPLYGCSRDQAATPVTAGPCRGRTLQTRRRHPGAPDPSQHCASAGCRRHRG